MQGDHETETPESRLAFGCVTTTIIGLISYWSILGALWELIKFTEPELDSDDTTMFIVLSVLAAPLAIPLLGFIVLTLWRTGKELFLGRRQSDITTVESPP